MLLTLTATVSSYFTPLKISLAWALNVNTLFAYFFGNPFPDANQILPLCFFFSSLFRLSPPSTGNQVLFKKDHYQGHAGGSGTGPPLK
jgi:hypothetical protein